MTTPIAVTREDLEAVHAGRMTRQELVEKLKAQIAAVLAARGGPADGSGPAVVEKIVLKKFDHTERTPPPGEPEDPIETIIIDADGTTTVIPGGGAQP